MPECPNCGHHVTEDYIRVFGDNDGNIIMCHHCEDDERISERDVAGLDDTYSGLMSENL